MPWKATPDLFPTALRLTWCHFPFTHGTQSLGHIFSFFLGQGLCTCTLPPPSQFSPIFGTQPPLTLQPKLVLLQAGNRQGGGFSPSSPRRNQPCGHLDV